MIHSQFIRHVVTMVSGNAFSQVISILAVPIIARLFNPDDFGVTAIFITVVAILASVAPLRYFRAGLIEKDDYRSHILLILSFRCLLVSCMVIFILTVVIYITGIELPFNNVSSSWIWFFLPIAMFIVGMDEIISSSLMRVKNFRAVSLSNIGNAFLTAGSRMVFGLSGSSVLGLVLGYLIGIIGKLVILRINAVRTIKSIRREVEWSEIKALAIEYKDFPLYNMPTALLSGVSRNLPILLMGLIFDPVVVGFYAMADRLIRRPLSVVGTPIREVFIVKVADVSNAGKSIKMLFIKVTSGLFVIGIVPFGLLTFYGEQIMDLLLGERWQGAGAYLEILAPWYYSIWVTMGVQPAMVVIRRQKIWLKVQVWMLIIRSAIFGVAYIAVVNVKLTLIWFSSVNVLMAVATLFLTFYILSRHNPVDNT